MAVRLDNLQIPASERKSLESGYLYKDIKFDLKTSRFTKSELYGTSELKDLDEIQDGQAVINSIKNILTTTPGQKLLNPLLGLDFRSYLFEPINSTTSYFLGYYIYNNLGIQEPRVTLNKLTITENPDQGEYIIDITFSIPNLDIYNLTLNATLNRDGYVAV
jgi:phage baseplate assembly protein W